ncbi:MAG: hybrid sensor histidine kinase/response regulator [Geothrix sp.]|uniref:hybrid sensor histidine kinase/response regulator n=1 Tax=Geothrix sp. TaxID=1962974 RepID=UPI0018181C39|nr:hybrid sensor histidine kinase/response regulator [Geothrix sp.]NWJ41097.1 hybrid sensor histidine kinase/response regulator [Geothrix sp.]WIL20911.1 MAG: hybrid sensor histidine kinase/response regulator [Geothrix sp.]
MLVPPADVLLVDDNPTNLDVLARVLRSQNHRVRTVTSGALALEAMRRQPPEVVLLDVAMPDMDGYQTCALIRDDPKLASIPVLFISAMDGPLDKVKAFESGGRDYVTKPFAAEEVLARVEHHVNLGRLQKNLEQQNQSLQDANLKLKEIHVLKANFTAMLVHDLRSPLTSVGLTLELLRSGQTPRPGMIDQAVDSFQRVQGLLDEMLDLHRSEHGQMPLRSDTIDPVAWLQGFADQFSVRAQAEEVLFQTYWPETLAPIKGDRSKLDRVLHNLLSNAIKFTPRGGAVKLEASVEFGAGVEAGLRFLRIAVIDTGRGIPAEQLPFIFDPFRQSEPGDAHRGFGLGLAIVQRLVAAHHGQIRAQSQLGFGSNFTVLLPC